MTDDLLRNSTKHAERHLYKIMQEHDSATFDAATLLSDASKKTSIADMFYLLRAMQDDPNNQAEGLLNQFLVGLKLTYSETASQYRTQYLRHADASLKRELAAIRAAKEDVERRRKQEELREIEQELMKLIPAGNTSMPVKIPVPHYGVKNKVLNLMDKLIAETSDELTAEEQKLLKFFPRHGLEAKLMGWLTKVYRFTDRKAAAAFREHVAGIADDHFEVCFRTGSTI